MSYLALFLPGPQYLAYRRYPQLRVQMVICDPYYNAHWLWSKGSQTIILSGHWKYSVLLPWCVSSTLISILKRTLISWTTKCPLYNIMNFIEKNHQLS